MKKTGHPALRGLELFGEKLMPDGFALLYTEDWRLIAGVRLNQEGEG